MPRDRFQVVGDQLSGRGLAFDASMLVGETKVDAEARRALLAEIAEAAYLQGRSAVLPPWDDRFTLGCAVDALRSLAVIVGPNPAGDRHRRAADVLARLLQDQEAGT